jgi:hypothetical protein
MTLPPIPLRLDGALVGSVFADNDGEGWQGHGERGLADVAITLAGPVMTTTTATGNGRFTLLNLPDGIYSLSAATPTGFAPISEQTITLANGGTVQVAVQSLGQVTGVVYEDWDGDGRRSHTEPRVTNPITMTLDGFDDVRLFGGNFLFWDVPDGVYELTGWWTAVAATTVTLDNTTAAAIALPAIDPGVVRGTVWYDANEDGLHQTWESPMAGIPVTVAGVTVITDEDGRFLFANVAEGTYTVEVELPEGITAVLPTITMGDQGAVVGIAATPDTIAPPSGYAIFLPLIVKN